MSKSILVIDTPKNCADCPCLYEFDFDGVPYKYECNINEKNLLIDEVDTKKLIGAR